MREKFLLSQKNLTVPEKTVRGDPLGFSNIHSDAKQQKNLRGEPLGKIFFRKKVSQCRKNEGGDPLVSPGMVCYAEKQGKPFWFSSLGQMVQFDAIIFCRTFKNFFGQFVWIEKKSHYNSRVSLHEGPTKKQRGTIGLSLKISRKSCTMPKNSKVDSKSLGNPLRETKVPKQETHWA